MQLTDQVCEYPSAYLKKKMKGWKVKHFICMLFSAYFSLAYISEYTDEYLRRQSARPLSFFLVYLYFAAVLWFYVWGWRSAGDYPEKNPNVVKNSLYKRMRGLIISVRGTLIAQSLYVAVLFHDATLSREADSALLFAFIWLIPGLITLIGDIGICANMDFPYYRGRRELIQAAAVLQPRQFMILHDMIGSEYSYLEYDRNLGMILAEPEQLREILPPDKFQQVLLRATAEVYLVSGEEMIDSVLGKQGQGGASFMSRQIFLDFSRATSVKSVREKYGYYEAVIYKQIRNEFDVNIASIAAQYINKNTLKREDSTDDRGEKSSAAAYNRMVRSHIAGSYVKKGLGLTARGVFAILAGLLYLLLFLINDVFLEYTGLPRFLPLALQILPMLVYLALRALAFRCRANPVKGRRLVRVGCFILAFWFAVNTFFLCLGSPGRFELLLPSLFLAVYYFICGIRACKKTPPVREPEDMEEPADAREPKGVREPENASRPENAGEPEGAREPKDAHRPENAGEPEGAREPKDASRPENAGELEGAGKPENAREPENVSRPEGVREPENAKEPEAVTEPKTVRKQENFLEERGDKDLELSVPVRDMQKSLRMSYEDPMRYCEMIYQYSGIRLPNRFAYHPLHVFYQNALLFRNISRSAMALLDYIEMSLRLVHYYVCISQSGDDGTPTVKTVMVTLEDMAANIFLKDGNPDLNRVLRLNRLEQAMLINLGSTTDMVIEGETMDFMGFMHLVTIVRNKIVAHGVLREANVVDVWCFFTYAALLLTEYLHIEKFRIEQEGDRILFGYDRMYDAGKYLLFDDGALCIASSLGKSKKQKLTYTNYFSGDLVVPALLEDIVEV